MEGQQIVMQDIFEFRQTGVDENGKVLGVFRPTGAVPSFYESFKSRGIKMDPAIFDPSLERDCPIEIIGRD
jgi:pilus assembly protein CpaF